MKKILVESILHKGSRRIKLVFEYNKELISLVKNISGSVWSYSLRCWHLPYSDSSIEEISNIQHNHGITLIQFNKLLEDRKFRFFDRKLPEDKRRVVSSFVNLMPFTNLSLQINDDANANKDQKHASNMQNSWYSVIRSAHIISCAQP